MIFLRYQSSAGREVVYARFVPRQPITGVGDNVADDYRRQKRYGTFSFHEVESKSCDRLITLRTGMRRGEDERTLCEKNINSNVIRYG